MSLDDLLNKKIGILGLGQEGLAVVRYLQKHNIDPVVYDKKDVRPQDINVKIVSGDQYLRKAIEESEIIFRSPGVKIPSEFNDLISEKGVIITSQTIWFFNNCPARIIGVTGTKGKGTTCSLLFSILEKYSETKDTFKPYLTGNIGKDQPFDFIEDLTKNDLVVYELSSFQLQDLKKSPYLGITLMVTEDHLDYHSDLTEYHSAKSAISAYQKENDIQIFNSDYEPSRQIGELGSGQKWMVSSKSEINKGAIIQESSIMIKGYKDTEITIDTTRRNLRGKHNLENIAAASLAATILGVDLETIQSCVDNFKGLKHRLQLVANKDGVTFYNDSISTIPEATMAALNSFTEPIILLLGGASKNLDYTELVKFIESKENLKAVITIGETGDELYSLIGKSNYQGQLHGPYTNFAEAVDKAKSIGMSGDVVLLSPAATSFDMFKSYADRGEQFIELVS